MHLEEVLVEKNEEKPILIKLVAKRVVTPESITLRGSNSSDILTVENPFKDHLEWEAKPSHPDWISLEESSGVVEFSQSIRIEIRDDQLTGNETSYEWTIVFTFPKHPKSPEEVSITYYPEFGTKPVASSGLEQTVLVGDVVTLDGSESYDLDGDELSYHWTAPAGIELSDSTSVKPRFSTETPGEYRITLVVNDGRRDSQPDEVLIKVRENTAPVADAGTDQTVMVGDVVTLDGSKSNDPNPSDVISYSWSAPAGISLSDATTARPRFTAPGKGPYLLTLTVKDGSLSD